MAHKSKRFREIEKNVDTDRSYSIEEAIATLKGCPSTKFDQSVELSLKVGVDPRKSDQQVRGTVSLPKGTGRKSVVLVFAKGDKVQAALDAGADYAGSDEFVEKVAGGWTDFTSVVATPDMMREVGKLGKVLGPRGLMPTPKAGTVTPNVAEAVQEIKAGKVEYRCDRQSGINLAFGKVSFAEADLVENLRALLQAIWRSKPATAKGQYFRCGAISSTMGPGLQLDAKEFPAV